MNPSSACIYCRMCYRFIESTSWAHTLHNWESRHGATRTGSLIDPKCHHPVIKSHPHAGCINSDEEKRKVSKKGRPIADLFTHWNRMQRNQWKRRRWRGAFLYVDVVELLVGLLVEPVAAHLPHDLIHPFPSLPSSSICLCAVCCLDRPLPMQGSNQGQRRTGTAAIFPCCLFFFFLSCWIGKLESTRASDGVGKGTKTKPRRGRESRPRRQPLLACRFRRRWRLTNSIFRTEIVCSLPSATGLDRVCSWISTGRDLSLARKVESHGRARSAPSFFLRKGPLSTWRVPLVSPTHHSTLARAPAR